MSDKQNTLSTKSRVLIGLCGFVMCAAIGIAIWQGQSIGWPAFFLLCGVGIVALIFLLTLLLSRHENTKSDVAQNTEHSLFSNLVTQLPDPSLYVLNNGPSYASTSYIDLARRLGADADFETPPPVDRVLNLHEKNTSAAMFRLYHTPPEHGPSLESMRVLTQSGDYEHFNVSVTTSEAGKLWQIKPQTEKQSASTLLRNAPIGLVSVGLDGKILEANDVLMGWLGYSEFDAPTKLSQIIETPTLLLGGDTTKGRTVRGETRLLTHKGVVIPTVLSARWYELDSGEPYASIALYGHTGLGGRAPRRHQNTTSKTTPASVNSADVFADAPFGVLWLDEPELATARILESNSTVRAMLGRDDLAGAHFSSIFEPSEALDSLTAQGVYNFETVPDLTLNGRAPTVVNVYFSTSQEFGLIAFIVDISQRKHLETQLGQSQKMQAIGQLAGGVAHDFNNLLTAIRLNTDELLGRHPIGDPSYPELQKINQTVSRAAGLVRKLLAFSRKQTMRTEALEVTETLSDMGVLLGQVLGERVKLDIEHGRGLPPIQADKIQLETVLMNLCVNARDAMLDSGGGTIIVRSSSPSPNLLRSFNIVDKDDHGFVMIEVVDTGTGMDEETQRKVFEPFFTTKEQGKGTGLGLATVYGIIEQLGAQMRLESTLGVGTTFKLFLPVASDEAITTAKAKPAAPARIKPTDLAGTGNILFVEDEVAVRSIAAKTLRKRGYTVVEAGDGEEAYELLEDMDEPFDLMISDVVMPGMDGPTLLKKGRSLLGDARIVFISGYAEEEFSELLAEEPDVTFLPKPFTLKELAEKVKSALQDVEE